jgi:activator of HSP90 ATPase
MELVDSRRGKEGRRVKKDSIKVSAIIAADARTIYDAWMSSKGHSAMTGSDAEVTARVGGKFSAWEGYIEGTTVELTPHSRIVQSWRTTEFPAEEPDSTLEVVLEETRGGTRVTLNHTDIPSGQGAEYKKGWIDFYFKPMKAYWKKK